MNQVQLDNHLVYTVATNKDAENEQAIEDILNFNQQVERATIVSIVNLNGAPE